MSAAACPNCATPASTGEYCTGCGQRNRNPRLHAGELVGQALDQMADLRAPWLRTFAELCWRPGGVALDYVEGRRARYVNPIKYCFIIVAAALAVSLWLGARADTDAGRAVVAEVPANVMALAAIPFEVLLMRLMFLRHARNATEIAVLCLLLTGQCVLIFQVVLAVLERSAATLGDTTLVAGALGAILVLAAYLTLGIRQFFQVPVWRAALAAAVVGFGSVTMKHTVGMFLRFGA